MGQEGFSGFEGLYLIQIAYKAKVGLFGSLRLVVWMSGDEEKEVFSTSYRNQVLDLARMTR